MQTSKSQSIIWFYLCLLIVTIVVVWFSQHSINAYWEQTYHQPSPLLRLSQYEWWKKGGELQKHAYKNYTNFKNNLEQLQFGESSSEIVTSKRDIHSNEMSNVSSNLSESVSVLQPDLIENSEVLINQNELSPLATTNLTDNKINLLPKIDKVLFAGDSLMQSVAPYIQQWLNKQQVKSINLSKPSTGLTYQSFFDWPEAIEKALEKEKNVRLLVMMLGANDPWGIVDPTNKGKTLNFQTPEWESVYINRIERILLAAKKRNIRVIWFGLPYMRSPKYDSKIRYLESIYEKTLTSNDIFVPVKSLISGGTDSYTDYIVIDGSKVKVRTKDGIHFSVAGAKMIGEQIQQYLLIQQ